MIFGDFGGLKLPDICLIGEKEPRKILILETCSDCGSNPGPLRDRHACYRLTHSVGHIFLAWYQLSNTLIVEACAFNQFSMLVCSSLCQNVVLLRLFHTRKEMKITGSQVRADNVGWSNTSHQKRFRSLFVAAAVCGRALSRRRAILEGNILRRFFLNKGTKLQHALYIWREILLF